VSQKTPYNANDNNNNASHYVIGKQYDVCGGPMAKLFLQLNYTPRSRTRVSGYSVLTISSQLPVPARDNELTPRSRLLLHKL